MLEIKMHKFVSNFKWMRSNEIEMNYKNAKDADYDNVYNKLNKVNNLKSSIGYFIRKCEFKLQKNEMKLILHRGGIKPNETEIKNDSISQCMHNVKMYLISFWWDRFVPGTNHVRSMTKYPNFLNCRHNTHTQGETNWMQKVKNAKNWLT